VTDAVVFDMDGVLIASEEVWDAVREVYVRERGGRYDAEVQRALMGMSSLEWSRYLHEAAGVPDAPEQINAEIVRRMLKRYREELPLIPGAVEAVRRVAARFPLGLASSSNRELIDAVLDAAGLTELFAATVSSEEVARGKPAPDVYLEAARRLGVAPGRCGAVEDSHGGIRAAKAAGMFVVAIPNPTYPPDAEALAAADMVLGSIHELEPDLFPQLSCRRRAACRSRGRKSAGICALPGLTGTVDVTDVEVPDVLRRHARSARSRYGLRAPSHSRARRRPPPAAPRSGHSRDRTPDPGARS
jgi:HAD superfamily hydrolase (TIGR01509 family)